MKHTFRTLPLSVMAMLLTVLLGGGCNSKESPTDDTIEYAETTTAITKFRLSANSKVAPDLDSVFFSIDLNKGVIWNQDSLPVGTDITKLVPVITFAKTTTEVTIEVSGATLQNDTTFNYTSNPNDSIDFSGRTVINVTALDGTTKRSYTVKMNVHKCKPDSLMWDELSVAHLPSRLGSPRSQKTVELGGKAYSLIDESNGTYTMASSADVFNNQWSKAQITLGFTPIVESMAASSEALYVLDDNGELHTSANGLQWTSTGEVWTDIIGGYNEYVLGIRRGVDGLVHTNYPASASLSESPVSADFPLTQRSGMGIYSSKWTDQPYGLVCGGRKADGTLSNATWAFDGASWAIISEHSLPALEGATLIPYYLYRATSVAWIQMEMKAWLVVGGKLADGSPNRTTYYSYDNGVNWSEASELMQLPESVPAMSGSNALVIATPRKADLSDAWTKMPRRHLAPGMRRISYETDGYEISWQCPYIYLFGGYDADGNLCNTIWRGVIARLSFAPII